jgi:tetratricopeptide (TPR) repeat protein
VTEIDNTLHDSLYLAELRAEIAANQHLRQTQQKRLRYYYWGLLGVVGIIAFAIVGGEFSTTLAIRTLSLVKFFLVALGFMFYLPRGYVAYQQHQLFAKRLDQFAPAYIPRTRLWDMVRIVGMYTLLSLLILFAVVLDNVWIILVLGIIGVRLFWLAYNKLLQWTYAGGLIRTDQVLKFLPGNFYLQMNRGALLMSLGRLDESAQVFKELLTRKQRRNIYFIPLLLNNLGYCLLLMKRYAEALPLLEASIRIAPSLTHTYDTLAGWYLEQKADPERALELTEIALELNNPKDIASVAIQQATSGRALFMTGRDTRAEAMLEQALSVATHLPTIVKAEINRQVGYARLAQGNETAAVEHFQKAVALDPAGLYGKMAQEALETINLQPAS